MSNLIFDRPHGTAWEAKWTEKRSTLIQPAATPGYETRVSLGPDPIRTLELAYSILKDGSLGITLNQLMGFFNLRGGDFDSFLVDLGNLTGNAARSAITGQVLTVDSNGAAPIQVTRYVSAAENWNENVYELAGVNGNPGTAPVIKLNGTPLVLTTDYTFHGPGYAIGNTTYPGMAVLITHSLGSPVGVVTADFAWYYRMRFAQPQIEVDQFFYLAWKAQQIEMVQTRT